MDSFRSSGWLTSGPSAGGAYPPVNMFRKGDDFIIIADALLNPCETEVAMLVG